jgi:6-phosphogluconolactonase (cycloisomerase 2 family)
VARRDPDTGALKAVGSPMPTPAPSFVARHPELPVAYAVNELTEGRVSAFELSQDGVLLPMGSWSTGGSQPCHVTVEPSGRHLLVANYDSGSITTFPLGPDGRPTHRASLAAHSGAGPHPQRQRGPHAHSVVVTGDSVIAVDLGADTIFRYPLDPASGELGPGEVAASLPPGTGPRHVAIAKPSDTSPEGGLHLVGELTATVTTFRTGPDGWREHGTVATTTAGDALPSEIAVSADGRFLYVGNRGPDTLAVFSLAGGLPALVGEVSTGGAWPRHFAIADQHLYVANQLSHTVVVFRLDPATGMPRPTGDIFSTPSPTCVLPW